MESTNLAPLVDYFGWNKASYWQWADDGSAVEWFDGPTILFRQELAVISGLQGQRGLPPLGAVLILIAACRDSWLESQSTLIRDISEISCIERSMPQWIGDVLRMLDRVHAVPRELVSSPQGKAELVDYVFEDQSVPRSDSVSGSAAAEFLRTGSETITARGGKPVAAGDLWHDLGVLRKCLAAFDPEAFARRVRTGVEHLVKPAEIELPPAERVRALLANLLEDPELCGVARLARQLLAAITLPRPLQEPDDLPLGGFSDLTNRGTLDRLLLSELASDDLTLAARVATNEALYLRREQPPRAPPLERFVLLDSGVRQWGLPRLITTALGMSLSAAGPGLETRTFRASHARITPVDLTRREGVEAHLKQLEATAHPGAALAQLSALLAHRDAAEAVVITSADALADDEFRGLLRDARVHWVATTQRDGHVQLWRVGARSLTIAREVHLDLDDLFEAPNPKGREVLRKDWRDLPAYCRCTRQPLRVPHRVTLESGWHLPGKGVLSLSKDRRLTLWENERYGPREIATNLPSGRWHWVDSRPEQTTLCAVVGTFGRRGLHLVEIGLEQNVARVTPLQHERSDGRGAVIGDVAYIYVITSAMVEVFTRDAQCVGRAAIPKSFQHVRQKYFRSKYNDLYVVGFDGAIRFECIRIGSPWLTALKPTDDGQIHVLLRDGRLLNVAAGEPRQVLKSEWRTIRSVLAVSRDEQRLALAREGSAVPFLLDLRSGEAGWMGMSNPATDIEPELWPVLYRPMGLRSRFRGIVAPTSGGLALVSHTGRRLRVSRVGERLELRDEGICEMGSARERPFQPVNSPGGYALGEAVWEDGSRAWLDSRCLLHLQSSQPTLPEWTLVLQERLAGWCADGRVFGDRYFIGPETQVVMTADQVDHELLSPFVRSLR